jgi:hypothetical protein
MHTVDTIAIASTPDITRPRMAPWPVIGPITAWLMYDAFISYIANKTLHSIAQAAEKMNH